MVASILPAVGVIDGLAPRAALLVADDRQCLRPEWRAATLALFPQKLPSGPPELQLALAQIYGKLALTQRQDLPGGYLLDWDARVRLPQVRLAWLRVELALLPERLPTHLGSPLLRLALRELRAADLPDPLALLGQLALCDDAELQGRALSLAGPAFHAGRLDPEELYALLLTLLRSRHQAVLAATLSELAEPWASCFPYPRAALAELPTPVAGVDAVADATLCLAAAAGQDGPVRGVLADQTAPGERRQKALRLLANLGRRDDLLPVLATAQTDPVLLGKAALFFLVGRHQRGHFVGPEHVESVLTLYLGTTELAADAVAPLLYPARGALLEYVAAVPIDDPRWERLLPLLCALAPDEPAVAPLLCALLGAATQPHRQRQVLAALARLRDPQAEEPALALLPQLPGEVLAALRAFGGSRTAAALGTALGLPAGDLAPWLRPFAAPALGLLWQLLDPGAPLRKVLLARLNPAALPMEIRADLGTRPPAEELALKRLADACPPALPAATALRTVALGGDVAEAEALLLRCIAELHGGAAPPDSDWVEEAPRVPAEALRGITALGQRLYERCCIRPPCLLDARSAAHAGELLLADLGLRLLQRSDLSEGERIILLKLLHKDVAPAALPAMAARLRPLLRDRSPHIRKLAIACLSQRGAERLAHNLTKLLSADDIQTVRQALLALGEMKARFAAPAIAGCLEHPNLNVKKTAAEALAQAGTPSVVPRILFWLGYHDNPGFRTSLDAALTAILGPARRPTLRAAHAQAKTPREKELLAKALGSAPADPPEGSIAAKPLPDQKMRPAVAALGQKGWQLERAQAVLATLADGQGPPFLPVERAALRPYLTEWLQLGAAAVPLVAQSCTGVLDPRERILLGDQLDLLLAALPRGESGRAELLDLLEQLLPQLAPAAALRVAAAYRGLPPAANRKGRSPFDFLRACGVVLDESDLHRALAECAGTSDPQAGARAVLREAFLAGKSGLPTDAAAQAARAAMETASYAGKQALAGLRKQWPLAARPRATLQLLIDRYPSAPAATQPELLEFMLALQPPFAAAVGSNPTPHPRREPVAGPHRSSAAWLAQLDAPDQSERRAAVQALLQLPDLGAQDALLEAYLSGRLEGLEDGAWRLDCVPLAGRLAVLPEERVGLYTQGAGRLRVARLAASLPVAQLPQFAPLLLSFWEDSDRELSAAAALALRLMPAEALLPALTPQLRHDRFGALDLLSGTVQSRPEWTALLARLEDAGRAEQAAALRKRTIEGPLAGSAAATAALAALKDRKTNAPAPVPALAPALPRGELLALARATDRQSAEPVRAALSALSQHPDPELVAVLIQQLDHKSPRVRLHAHRLLRGCVDRQQYLELTCRLLEEKDLDIRRLAIRTLSHGRYAPALRALVALLGDSHPLIRTAAAQGVRLFGNQALPTLQGAQRKQRPDRRAEYAAVIAQIEEDLG